jgi:hypothetical protein
MAHFSGVVFGNGGEGKGASTAWKFLVSVACGVSWQ